MNQMNNNEENILDVEKLYELASRLKESRDERINLKAILKKNPGPSIRNRYDAEKIKYLNALNDFYFFAKNYVNVVNSKEGVQKFNEEELRNFINSKLNSAFDEYFKNGEVK